MGRKGLKQELPKTKCELCDKTEELEYHRIDRKGPYEKENVQVLCKKCHMLVHYRMRINPQV